MGQVSKRPIDKDVFERMFELLLQAITDARSSSEANLLLKDLLTPTERVMVAKRLAIAVLLSQNETYKLIEDILKVSKPTIAMVNGQFKHGEGGYRHFAKKLASEKNWQKLWDKIEDMTTGQVEKREKGSGIWVKLQEQTKRGKQKRSAI